jgi:FMN phosphatase YigB (HAD superfamily)
VLTTILFDMDNTLLENHNETFSPGFFGGLASYIDPPVSIDVLLHAFEVTDEQIDNYADGDLTTCQLWRQTFYREVGRDDSDIHPQVMRYLAEGFPKLESLTRQIPYARRVVELAFEKSFEVVIATGMYLPQSCLEQRLKWAGVPASEFSYRFLTSWDNMHTGKATSAYYVEVLKHIDRQPSECLMIGDSLKVDMIPALEIGIPAYLALLPDRPAPDHDLALAGQGTLEDFYAWLQNQN